MTPTATGPPPVPNPGSTAAYALGCTCAELDNNHGKHPPRPPDGWWITVGCPVHTGPLIPDNPKPKE
jgi:hypothetical protein